MKKFLLSVIAVCAIACGLVSCGGGVKSASFKNGEYDTLAYAYGVLFGTQYSNFTDPGVVVPDTNVVMNLDNFLNGFVNAIRKDSTKLLMSTDEANAFLQVFQSKMRQKMDEERQAKLNENKAKGAEFMAKNATEEGVEVTESGLQIKHLTVGTGKQAKDGDKVLVNYKGTLVDGTQFDANDSIEFNTNGVVKGFKEGLLAMKEGGKAVLVMPSNLAYGDTERGANLPGGSTLIFEVELLKVIPAGK